MCPCFHTKQVCHVKCKFAVSHIPAKDVPKEVKKAYCNYLAKIRQLKKEVRLGPSSSRFFMLVETNSKKRKRGGGRGGEEGGREGEKEKREEEKKRGGSACV